LRESQKAYVSLAEAEKAYSIVCEEFHQPPRSHTQLWKYLELLSALGILTTGVSAAGSRGRSTIIYLPRIPVDELERELSKLLEGEGA
jgi:Cdc6-like AAA superfamily ATPase